MRLKKTAAIALSAAMVLGLTACAETAKIAETQAEVPPQRRQGRRPQWPRKEMRPEEEMKRLL